MNKLTALVEAAKAATTNGMYQHADWGKKCPPSTILELCALLEKAEEALKEAEGATAYESHDDSVGYRVCCQVQSFKPHKKGCKLNDALAAIKQWKEQT